MTREGFRAGTHFGGARTLIPGVIGVVNPGPPRRRKSPLHEVRRMRSYVTKSPTKPMKPPAAAAPAPALAPPALAPPVIGTGTGTGTGARANALFGTATVNTNAVAMAACTNLFIGASFTEISDAEEIVQCEYAIHLAQHRNETRSLS
jgi:hypothetical protein